MQKGLKGGLYIFDLWTLEAVACSLDEVAEGWRHNVLNMHWCVKEAPGSRGLDRHANYMLFIGKFMFIIY
jgi:hypothetical protein